MEQITEQTRKRAGAPVVAESDLASESTSYTHEDKKIGDFTVRYSTHKQKTVFTVKIGNASALVREQKRAAARTCKTVICELFYGYNITSITPVTVICLGNSSICADSLGPLCAKKIYATRHLKNELPHLFSTLGGREITVIEAGVTAKTGVTALEVARACVEGLAPKLIITVDALKASRTENLLSTLQISYGVAPGSGTDCSRPEITKSTVGVPVISIGVPTVISPATIACDLQNPLSIAPVTLQNIRSIAPAIRQNPNFAENSRTSSAPLLVSAADCESSVNAYADIISDAVNLALLGTFFD